jgi:ornithine cyclodeaminase
MKVVDAGTIRACASLSEAVEAMRNALIAQSRGECDTPMPMHLEIAPEKAEVHIKSSYRRGGRFFALKVAAGFPGNLARGLSVGSGMMLLSSAETGEPVAVLADGGYLTDLRTAAVSAMVAKELGRGDSTLGILGTGIQARLQAELHAEVMDLEEIRLWGRAPERVERCLEDVRRILPGVEVASAASPAELARRSRLIVTATASREPLLSAGDLQPGTHVSAVGSDSAGKQELDPEILRRASLLLVDSRAQCERLGELQHAPDQKERAIEIGAFCASPARYDRQGVTVCDFTGLGVEDLFIAEQVYMKDRGRPQPPHEG